MSSRPVTGAVGFTAIVACALTTPAAGLAAWSAPQVAATTYGEYRHIVLGSDVAGDLVVAWERELETEASGCVEAVTREGPTTWTRPALLSRDGESMYPLSVRARIDGRGDATVTWVAPFGELNAAARRGASRWGPSRRVVRSAEEGDGTQLLLDADEHTTIVFLRSSNKGSGRVQTVSVAPDRRYGPPRTIYSRKTAFFPRELTVATDERGEGFLAWVDEGRTTTVQALILAANGKPEGPVQTFPKHSGVIDELQVQTNRQGDALLAWQGRTGLEVATRTRGDRFSSAARLSRTLNGGVTSAVEPDGHMALLFTHFLGRKATAVEIISSSDRGWTVQRPLAPGPPSTSTFAPQLAANPLANELIAIWATAPTEPPGLPAAVSVPARDAPPLKPCAAKPVSYTPAPEGVTERTEASTQVGEEGWQPAVSLSEGGQPAALTINPAGVAVAAWTKESAPQRQTIYVSQYRPSQ